MDNIAGLILENKFKANEWIEKRLDDLKECKLAEAKKALSASLWISEDIDEDFEILDEAPRIKIVKARIRNGKVQRRKKISNVKGFTFRGGKLKRMTPKERRNRKLGQKRGKIKRRAKLNRALMKRKRSLRKRKSLGLK